MRALTVDTGAGKEGLFLEAGDHGGKKMEFLIASLICKKCLNQVIILLVLVESPKKEGKRKGNKGPGLRG